MFPCMPTALDWLAKNGDISMTVNKVILIGNLGADPEVRATASGSRVANLRIATTERRRDREGNWSDHTEWHRVVCFGKTAENVERFLSKGRQVYIEGRLQTRKWTDQDGRDRYNTEVVADQVRFLGRRGDDAGGGGGGGSSYGGGGSSNSGGGSSSGGGGGGGSSYDSGGGSSAGGGAAGGGGGGSTPPDDDIPF